MNGHTSSEWNGDNFKNSYLKNAELSMKRSFSTIRNMFNMQNKDTQVWLTKILKGSGYSYSKKIVLNGNENRVKSRKVGFKIILKPTT